MENRVFLVVLSCAVMSCVFVCADTGEKGYEDETVLYKNYLEQLQTVPLPEVTAEKLHRFYLGGSSKERHPLFHARNKKTTGRFRRYSPNEYYDVIYVIDASGSIKEKEFRHTIAALETLITKAKRSTKYAIIVFSEEGEIRSYFEWPPATRVTLKAVEYQGYRTNTQDALKKCQANLFMNMTSGVRRESYKRILIITDGRSNVENKQTLYRAMDLKIYDVEVFVVAVGRYIKGIEELVGLATTRRWHMFRVESMKGFVQVVKLIPPIREMEYNTETDEELEGPN